MRTVETSNNADKQNEEKLRMPKIMEVVKNEWKKNTDYLP